MARGKAPDQHKAAAADAPPAAAPERAVVVASSATTTLARHVLHKHTWRLEGVTRAFFEQAQKNAKLRSPIFKAAGFDWQLELVPSQDAVTEAEAPSSPREPDKYVALFLNLVTPDTTVAFDFDVWLGNSSPASSDDLVDPFTFSTKQTAPANTFGCGYDEFISHADLLKDFSSVVPGGMLSVGAVLRQGGFVESDNPISVSAPSLAGDLAALLESGRDADVTLLCGGERVTAHALLLKRSPVFAAQLSEGPLQADASGVAVPDDVTPRTLRRLLQYLYTDELEPESPEEATHLLNAADHYGCTRLFAICERTLCGALAFDNVAATLTLADAHNAAALKRAALQFVVANPAQVLQTPEWMALAAARPSLVNEALHLVMLGALPPAAPLAAGSGAADDAAGGSESAGGAAAGRKRRR